MKKRLFPKMKVGPKRKWLEALRSRKFKRTTGKLGSVEDGFCCLGVLCHVNKLPYCPEGALLGEREAGKVGLDTEAQHVLAAFNDGDANGSSWDKDNTWGGAGEYSLVPKPKGYRNKKGTSFNAIADWVEKYL